MHDRVQTPQTPNSRRTLLRRLAMFAAAAPSLLQTAIGQQVVANADADDEEVQVIRPPIYRDEIMRIINLHEFEDVARKNLSAPAYDYIVAGAGDENTLRANRQAFGDYWIRRKVMVDVTKIDTSLELLGQRLEHPILLGPVEQKRLLHRDGDVVTSQAAYESKAVLVGGTPSVMQALAKKSAAPLWWAATLGDSARADAVAWAKEAEDAGATALCVSVDYPYAGARDRPSRDKWEAEWSQTAQYDTEGGPVSFQAGMIDPFTPDLTWEWMKWVRSASKLPIVVKGITNADDSKRAIDNGAQAVVVSNHGARTLDGMGGTLHALPEVVDAVNGKVPVLVDGGIRRGGDVIKALALGAKAVLIGRPYLWGLAAFGQEGVQRVIELLQGELKIALALSGTGNLRAVDRSLIRPAWKPYVRNESHSRSVTR